MSSQYRESPKQFTELEGENSSFSSCSEDPDLSQEVFESPTGTGTVVGAEFDPEWKTNFKWKMASETEIANDLTSALAQTISAPSAAPATTEVISKGAESSKTKKIASRQLKAEVKKNDYKSADQLALWRALNRNPEDQGLFRDDLTDLQIHPESLQAAVEVGKQKAELQALIEQMHTEVQQAQLAQKYLEDCTAASKAATEQLAKVQESVAKGIASINSFVGEKEEIKRRLTVVEGKDQLIFEQQAHHAVEKEIEKRIDFSEVRTEIGKVHSRVDETKKDNMKQVDWRWLEHQNKKQIQILDFDVKKMTGGRTNEDDLENSSEVGKLNFTTIILKEIWKDLDVSDIAKVTIKKYKGEAARRGKGANSSHIVRV